MIPYKFYLKDDLPEGGRIEGARGFEDTMRTQDIGSTKQGLTEAHRQ